jgi:hypothetical protein
MVYVFWSLSFGHCVVYPFCLWYMYFHTSFHVSIDPYISMSSKHWFCLKYQYNKYMFNFIDIYSFIPVSDCVGRDPSSLLCPGPYNAANDGPECQRMLILMYGSIHALIRHCWHCYCTFYVVGLCVIVCGLFEWKRICAGFYCSYLYCSWSTNNKIEWDTINRLSTATYLCLF